jgi:two-component sensor histidine kinase
VVADDGIGLPEDTTWPVQGKLGALILQTLKENAAIDFSVESGAGKGMRVTIGITHKSAPPRPN